ncbi:dihydrofolate reductase [Pseudomonas poae]|uniref:dihydrofolate reductase n=1 Tax=Pseudomonas poae TaxID=200451 RepID=UPI0030D25D45
MTAVWRLWYSRRHEKTLPLSLIAALGENRVIGVDNSMPWHLPGDFKYFKATTLGKPIIMGRKTWDSLGRPLPGRLNLVVSRQTDLALEGAQVFPSLEAAVQRAEEWALEQGVDELMLIGGAQLYAQGLEQADRLYLTRVALSPEGDAWFPEFDRSQWTLVSNVENAAEGDKPAYNFEVWEKA